MAAVARLFKAVGSGSDGVRIGSGKHLCHVDVGLRDFKQALDAGLDSSGFSSDELLVEASIPVVAVSGGLDDEEILGILDNAFVGAGLEGGVDSPWC